MIWDVNFRVSYYHCLLKSYNYLIIHGFKGRDGRGVGEIHRGKLFSEIQRP